ncbi:MAG: cytochrome-c peroxidase [Polyangiales bacterium]
MRMLLERCFWFLAILLGLDAGCPAAAQEPTCPTLSPELNAWECLSVKAMRLASALPPARGNAHGDDPGAAQLGFAIFYDARFSSNQSLRCASCHAPDRGFQDGKPVAIGLATLTRNTPTALDVAQMTGDYFWDGRADSLWSQAIFPLENRAEMGLTRLELAHRIATSYASAYAGVFGALPALDDMARFPAVGSPGDASYEGMASDDRDAVDRVAANVGKSLEAYERMIPTGTAAIDRFVDGDATALNDGQRRGLVTFVHTGCVDCHSNGMFTDQAFHNLGMPSIGAVVDRGRADGLVVLAANRFNSQGQYWDGPRPPPPPAPTDADVGAFRTPSLRNVSVTAPYAHDGRFASLREVIVVHPAAGALSSGDVDDVIAFLGALEGDYPPPPWNDWPDR